MLNADIELIEGIPAIYIKSISALAIADLHLGYEAAMAKRGVFIPKVNLNHILELLHEAYAGRRVKELIIVGDVKNEFSGVLGDEINELAEISRLASSFGSSITVVKGNHDNFIDRVSRGTGVSVCDLKRSGGYLFAHGDKKIDRNCAETIIIGHEHPSIGVPWRSGRVEHVRCFLVGMHNGAKMIVLPASGYFETGSDVNRDRGRARILSPMISATEMRKMRAIAVGYESTIDFGSVGDLTKLY